VQPDSVLLAPRKTDGGAITAMTADENAYTVQTEDGRLFNVEWYAGYSGWDVYG